MDGSPGTSSTPQSGINNGDEEQNTRPENSRCLLLERVCLSFVALLSQPKLLDPACCLLTPVVIKVGYTGDTANTD